MLYQKSRKKKFTERKNDKKANKKYKDMKIYLKYKWKII